MRWVSQVLNPSYALPEQPASQVIRTAVRCPADVLRHHQGPPRGHGSCYRRKYRRDVFLQWIFEVSFAHASSDNALSTVTIPVIQPPAVQQRAVARISEAICG